MFGYVILLIGVTLGDRLARIASFLPLGFCFGEREDMIPQMRHADQARLSKGREGSSLYKWPVERRSPANVCQPGHFHLRQPAERAQEMIDPRSAVGYSEFPELHSVQNPNDKQRLLHAGYLRWGSLAICSLAIARVFHR